MWLGNGNPSLYFEKTFVERVRKNPNFSRGGLGMENIYTFKMIRLIYLFPHFFLENVLKAIRTIFPNIGFFDNSLKG